MILVVEVSCLVDFEDLDDEDRLEDGSCAVDGGWHIEINGIPEGTSPEAVRERALDIFHRIVPIAVLDDFHILVRPWNRNADLLGWMRGSLGTHDWTAPLPDPWP